MSASGRLRVLIVEDEALLAMDMETMVEDCGHTVVGEAASLAEVAALDIHAPDLAFVDMQLAAGSNGLEVSDYIRRHWDRTAIVFVTANLRKIPADFAGAHGVIPKPFSRNGLISALNYLDQGLTAPPPSSALPESFILAPAIRSSWAVA